MAQQWLWIRDKALARIFGTHEINTHDRNHQYIFSHGYTYQVDRVTTPDQGMNIVEWLNTGVVPGKWCAMMVAGIGVVGYTVDTTLWFFTDERAALMFKMRWC